MNIRGRFLVILFGLLLITTVWAEFRYPGSGNIPFLVSTDGDSAQIVRVGDVFLFRDSFVYKDSIQVQFDTGLVVIISWLSPLQTMILTPTFDASTTYSCSLRTGATAKGFTFDATGETNLAGLTLKLKDSINIVAGIKDTLLGEDSATYVKVISKFSQITLPGDVRWIMSFAVAGGTGTLDTATQLTINDSILIKNMVDSINAEDSTGFYLTAAVEADTSYSVTANQKGVLFFMTTQKDTAGDTTTLTVNATSSTTFLDTFAIVNMMAGRGTTIIGQFIVKQPGDTSNGPGASDSVIIRKYTQFGGTYVQLVDDSANCGSVPCTLQVTYSGDISGVDTLFKENFIIIVEIIDSTSDSVFTVNFPYRYNFIQRKANE